MKLDFLFGKSIYIEEGDEFLFNQNCIFRFNYAPLFFDLFMDDFMSRDDVCTGAQVCPL